MFTVVFILQKSRTTTNYLSKTELINFDNLSLFSPAKVQMFFFLQKMEETNRVYIAVTQRGACASEMYNNVANFILQENMKYFCVS